MPRYAPILRARALALALATLLPVTGCSLAFLRPPPEPDPATGSVECSPGSVAPVADALLSLPAALVGLTYYALAHLDFSANADGNYDSGTNAGAWTAMAVAASPFIASAGYGFHQNGECRNAKATPRTVRCDPATGATCGREAVLFDLPPLPR
jgi:hypothetical protein